MIVVVAASPAVDRSYRLDSLRLGAIHRPGEVVATPGGKGLNVARAATALGARVSTVAVLAGATGAWIGDELRAAGVAVIPVPAPGQTRTCLTLADQAAGGLTEVYESCAPLPESVQDALLAAIGQAVRDGEPGWLVLAGSWPGSPAALSHAIATARSRGWSVAVDTSGAPLAAALAAEVDLIKVNRAEAEDVLSVVPGALAVDLATALADRSHGLVVLTDGSAGAVAVQAGVPGSVSAAVPARGPFPVGSGDCFLAGLLSHLDGVATPARTRSGPRPGWSDLGAALATATATAAANAEVLGAAVFSVERARQLRTRVVLRQGEDGPQ